MIIYRPHKGSLDASLKEAKEFNTEQEMKEHIFHEWESLYRDLGFSVCPFEISDIVIKNEAKNDNRCGWYDTRYVCVKRLGSEDYMKLYGSPQCIGMCATDYEK